MGSGHYSDSDYSGRASLRAATGKTAFDYDRVTKDKPVTAWAAHETLNPKATNKNGPYTGKNIREARDNPDHPETLPIAVMFDVTGSMQSVPRVVQKKLPQLMGLLLRKGYVQHPQLLVGAIGDATCDKVPLQVSQFESDVRIDDHINNIFLEGAGGGQDSESYALGMYFLAKCAVTDAWEKRQKKGYAFFVGDEKSWPATRGEIERLIGNTEQEDWSVQQCLEALREQWEVFFITPNLTGHYNDAPINKFWKDLFGERFIKLDDPNTIAEFIATQVGLCEGSVDMDGIHRDLAEIGTSAVSVTKALAKAGVNSGVPATVPDSGAASGIATV